ncbi:DgyrCDS5587 [Dimorphilus gyrociliatus]|uniref:GCS light chain n=1 Tax=Dimorphilus gyrociliatus TaxID=2664684 RepID=A0A7I8VKC0_9ANNE|nr:DgyrCDS5587 [Dimorphilus gyrociliatus]
MEESSSTFPKASEIFIHTGNIVNWNRLSKRIQQTPKEELADCIKHSLHEWLKTSDKDDLQYIEKLSINTSTEKLSLEDRSNFKITVKLFMNQANPNSLDEAIQDVMTELGIKTIETVLVALPEKLFTFENIENMWTKLEEYVDENKIFSIGFSDLDTDELERLYNTAKIKPTVNQVNLDSCCEMPTEMVNFAKEHDITLLTHNDPTDIITNSALQQIIRSESTERDGAGWQATYTTRYSVLIKSRGIIHSKGYLLKGKKGWYEKEEVVLSV